MAALARARARVASVLSTLRPGLQMLGHEVSRSFQARRQRGPPREKIIPAAPASLDGRPCGFSRVRPRELMEKSHAARVRDLQFGRDRRRFSDVFDISPGDAGSAAPPRPEIRTAADRWPGSNGPAGKRGPSDNRSDRGLAPVTRTRTATRCAATPCVRGQDRPVASRGGISSSHINSRSDLPAKCRKCPDEGFRAEVLGRDYRVWYNEQSIPGRRYCP